MSEYKMIIHTFDDFVGHYAIEFKGPSGNPKVYGFHPKNKLKGMTTLSTPGDFRSDYDLIYGKEKEDHLSSKPTPLTKEQFEKGLAKARDLEKNPGNYDANKRSCIDIGNTVVQSTGMKGDIDDYLSKGQREHSSLGSISRRWKFARDRREQEIKDGKLDHPLDSTGYDSPNPDKDTDLKGGTGQDTLSAPKPEVRPEVKAFLEDVKKPLDDTQEILLKDPKSWTREELNKVMASKDYMTLGKPERQQAYDKVAGWFSEHYGDEPVERMISGQMMQPNLKRQPNKTPLTPKTADGHDMGKATAEIGKHVADMAGKGKLTSAVKALQAGLSLMEQKGVVAPLKQDGVFGPKTKTALRTTLATQGKAKTEEAFSLGNFNRLAQKTRKFGNAEGLERRLDKAVAPLFGEKPSKSPKPTYKPWGEALQGTINDSGHEVFGEKKWEPLKEDGLVGPKTETAFSTVAKSIPPEELSKRFAHNLGWV